VAITSQSLTSAQRRVFPGITDLLFVFLVVSQLGARIFSADTGWHLWAGLHVLAHGPGAIPDALSFTRAGAPWRNLEWLGEVLLALAWRHAGYFGVALMCSLVFAATFTWLYRILLHDSNHAPAALAVTVLTALVAYLHALARPVLFTFPLLLAAWELTRAPRRPRLLLIALPALTVLWANVHPSAILAPILAGYALFSHSRTRIAAATLALALLALGATPWGFAWLREISPHGGDLAWIDEWAAPRFDQLRFIVLLAFILLSLLVRVGAERGRRAESMLGLVALAAALRSARMAPLAAIVWAPALTRDLAARLVQLRGVPGRVARTLQETFDPFEKAFRPGLWPALGCVVAFAMAPRIGALWPEVKAGFPESAYPKRALAAAERLGLGPRVLSDYGWGGYVPWVSHGRYRVFCDGRLGLFAGDVLEDYDRITHARPGWETSLARRPVDWMLVRPADPIAAVAPLTGRWRVAYSDPVAVILILKQSPAAQ
jgi:hypothetical protein